ncbi:MAG: outer-membrane lipoprotein carrier protein LolA [Muribaculaceae bacterium]|nr:outer-membrane lipoprotein carrier protein LolA [Muribaculaceae bacterium]
MAKKLLSLIFVLVACSAQAQNATAVFDKMVAAFKAGGTISANYSMNGSKGTIVMQGAKFRILANDIKSWFNGKTQWTYSDQTGEVNIVDPTAQELQMTNPLAAAKSLKDAFSMTSLKAATGYAIKLTPKKKSNVKSITLYISKAYVLTAADYVTNNGTYNLKLTNYKTKQNYPASTFVFDKKLVPAGTEVVDLR